MTKLLRSKSAGEEENLFSSPATYLKDKKSRLGGGYAGVVPPDPIPNSEVKYSKADDNRVYPVKVGRCHPSGFLLECAPPDSAHFGLVKKEEASKDCQGGGYFDMMGYHAQDNFIYFSNRISVCLGIPFSKTNQEFFLFNFFTHSEKPLAAGEGSYG